MHFSLPVGVSKESNRLTWDNTKWNDWLGCTSHSAKRTQKSFFHAQRLCIPSVLFSILELFGKEAVPVASYSDVKILCWIQSPSSNVSCSEDLFLYGCAQHNAYQAFCTAHQCYHIAIAKWVGIIFLISWANLLYYVGEFLISVIPKSIITFWIFASTRSASDLFFWVLYSSPLFLFIMKICVTVRNWL